MIFFKNNFFWQKIIIFQNKKNINNLNLFYNVNKENFLKNNNNSFLFLKVYIVIRIYYHKWIKINKKICGIFNSIRQNYFKIQRIQLCLRIFIKENQSKSKDLKNLIKIRIVVKKAINKNI